MDIKSSDDARSWNATFCTQHGWVQTAYRGSDVWLGYFNAHKMFNARRVKMIHSSFLIFWQNAMANLADVNLQCEAVHRSYSSQRAENGYSENLEFAATLRLLYCKFTLKFHPSLSGCSTRLLKKLRSACSILGRKFWDDNRILFQPNGVPLGARRWLILCTASCCY